MKKTLTEEEVSAIFNGDTYDYEEEICAKWDDDEKYSFGTMIAKDKEGLFWRVRGTRSGSYFSDYDYQWDTEIVQVEEVEVKRFEWFEVKDKDNG